MERRRSVNTCKILTYNAPVLIVLHQGAVFSFRQISGLYPPLVCSIGVAHSFYQKLLQSGISNPVCKHHLIAMGLSVLNLH